MNLLLVDDEKELCNALSAILLKNNYSVDVAYDGETGLDYALSGIYDLIMLDVMLPKMNGFEILKKLRAAKIATPVLMLTARSETRDKIEGLNIGADDYITKPFNPLEVTARVRSQLRRYLKLGGGVAEQESYTIGGIELNDRNKEVFLDGEPVQVTPKEYDILKLLMANPGRVFSPKEIYSTVWKEKPFGTDNTVAVHIRHLREKLEIDPSEPRYIKVIFGQGYKIEKGR